ncbi:MAG: hypothetical protein ACPL0A_02400, partial [Candidatus Micrarchaeia archaeon]
MCDLCKRLANTHYPTKISQYMLEDVERMLKTENVLLFSQETFPYIEPLLYLEPRVAMPKPTRYYQSMEIDGKALRLDWSSGAMRAIGLKNNEIVVLTKSVIKQTGQPERFNYYFLAKLKKDELDISETNNEIKISYKGNVSGINLKTRKMENHELSFSFIHQHNENAFIPKSRLTSSSLYSKSTGDKGQAILSRFEEYAVTVMHFAPHPMILQVHKELGFETPLDLQR